jgi:glycoside/pentoside/hexuronide:cation symporter, GPH family
MATFVAGIAGALCQLWLGYIGDRFESRWGRRRPFIVVMSLFAGAAIVALMFPPGIVTHGGYAAPWFFILFTILEIARETTELSYDSLGTEVTQDEEERSELYAYQAGMGVVGILFVAGGNAILSYSMTETESFKILGLAIGLLSTGGNVFLAWYIKENPAFKEQGAMPLVPGFRSCMANKPWILCVRLRDLCVVGWSNAVVSRQTGVVQRLASHDQ